MDSASLSLIFFGLAAALIISISAAPRWRLGTLFGANMIFLVALGARPNNILPFMAFLFFGYLALKIIEKKDLGKLVPAFLFGIVLLFAYLKKYTFFSDQAFITSPYFTLGLSYIFFRVMHLVIEARDMPPATRPSLFDYICYTTNFTTLISGPIQRFDEFKEGFSPNHQPELNFKIAVAQLERIAIGYFKVNVVASILDIVRVEVLVRLNHSSLMADRYELMIVLIVVYPFFLYANFSGYIDIVIAIARLMRIRLPENFDHPFSASSFLDFWNRWHITLSQWLKAYVYNPLLMASMRQVTSVGIQPYLGVACFFVTFFLIGIWHGRTSEFAVFGLLQGGGVALNKLWQIYLSKQLGRKPYKALADNPFYVAGGRGLTFSWFAFTMFWFWGDWSELQVIFSRLTAWYWVATWCSVVALSTLGLALWNFARSRAASVEAVGDRLGARDYFKAISVSLVVLLAFFYCALLNQPAPGIIYKAF